MILINTISLVFNVGGDTGNVGYNPSLAFFKLVATSSYIFFYSSKDNMFSSLSK